MEKIIYCDTYVIVMLNANRLSEFPRQVLKLLEHSRVLISPMVLLELEYLYEIGRIKTGSDKILRELEKSVGLNVCTKSFIEVANESLKHSWTRDPFDRIIVAQASLSKSTLVTKDEFIRKYYAHAVWD